MKLIVSKKNMLVNGSPVIDRQTIQNAIDSLSGVQTKIVLSDEEATKYINAQVLRGFTCHTFDYTESFAAQTNVLSVKAA